MEPKTLTVDEARSAIREVVAAFNEPANLEKMNKARAEAGDDLAKMMQIVVPVALQIQTEVIKKYGFEPDNKGVMAFTMAIKAHSPNDEEISRLEAELKKKFLPQKKN
ncbi:protein c10 [Anaeramoeba ignava]|uniref:Protein C10 n=1 Tax=Anaeramoeba ignava TaxID=1746090 RepID=A0A9Q0RFC9_ANAIG|nr:protein c10 [Anaeramoeba ignava]|eukprot:Anaeramoba_ignava/a518_66.p2 GENE.a518_66~~a518_66.p2  ORF type:complete len:108 (-),score=34.47 a518_66:788-1111(-)